MELSRGFDIRERESSGQLVVCFKWASYVSWMGSRWERFPNGWEVFDDLVIPSNGEIMSITGGKLPSDEFLQSILDQYTHK